MTTPTYQDPEALRRACRTGAFDAPTAGHAPGRIQANLIIVPRALAFDMLLFCQRNPKPCPLVEVLDPGRREARCAAGSDIATDLPGYRVYRHGDLVEERSEIASLWREDFVSFLIGCSFSFEDALMAGGIGVRHIELGTNVPMYRSRIPCTQAGDLHGEMVVSMRPLRGSDVARAVEISSRFPQAHGAPIHVGHPEAIGIRDLARPDYGDPVPVAEEEVPVFWACGVTPQWVAQRSALPMCITHAPGKMFITDLPG